MKRLLTFVFIPLILISCGGSKELELDKCIVTFLQGNVSLLSGDNITPLSVGDTVSQGEKVQTMENSSCELQFSDRSLIRIKPLSTVSVVELHIDSESLQTTLNLKDGQMFVHSESLNEGSSFEVQTETITTGIRGTQFSVTADDDQSILAVREGNVKVTQQIDQDKVDSSSEIDDETRTLIKSAVEDGTVVGADKKVIVTSGDKKEAQDAFDAQIDIIEEKKRSGESVIDTEQQQIRDISRQGIEPDTISEEEREALLPDEEFNSMQIDRDVLNREDRVSIEIKLNTGPNEPVMVYVDNLFYAVAFSELHILLDKSKTRLIGFTAKGYAPKQVSFSADIIGDKKSVTISVTLEPSSDSESDVYRPKSDEEVKQEAEEIRDEVRSKTDSLRSDDDNKLIRETETKTDDAVNEMEDEIEQMKDPDYDAESDLESEMSDLEKEMEDLK